MASVMILRLVSIIAFVWFEAMGVPKLLGASMWTTLFERWGYPSALMYAVGVIETVGGLMLLFRRTSIIGAAALLVVMMGAAYTHTLNLESVDILKPVLSALVLVWIILRRRDESRRAGRRS